MSGWEGHVGSIYPLLCTDLGQPTDISLPVPDPGTTREGEQQSGQEFSSTLGNIWDMEQYIGLVTYLFPYSKVPR